MNDHLNPYTFFLLIYRPQADFIEENGVSLHRQEKKKQAIYIKAK